ncbi:MAG: nuclear transport factor 2 family protein [bacterium]|nr:hypothetical protein [Deltaproteobacteria bacterium]MCP4908801.1 nuclear transport factor 2 family protein [bacterium]
MATLEERFCAMEDREAIRELTGRYCQFAVGGRAEEMAGLFTTDGELELDGTVEHGRERLLEIYRKPFEAVRPIPTVHNHVIDLDGDQATGYCAPALRMVQEGEAVTAAAHQEDLFEWEEGV